MQAHFYNGKNFSANELELITKTLRVSAADENSKTLCREIRVATCKYQTNADVQRRRSRELEAWKKLQALQKMIDGLDEHATNSLAKLPATQGGGKFMCAFFSFYKTALIDDPIVDGDSNVPLMTLLKCVFEKKRRLPARKDFKIYPTIADDGHNQK